MPSSINPVVQVNNGGEVPIMDNHKQDSPPIFSSYNHKIRPILDALDNLRSLNVTHEGIHLPTIVVIGDQSSGKSSVLESLAGVSLPRGQNICTRVPLIIKLQTHADPVPELLLEYQEKSVKIMEERQISNAIRKATVEIAGKNKGILNVPLTLVVKKKGVPNLTMIDLPGITRVPIGDQPENIYKQITDMIMEHIKPEESIILNVLAANVDFATCESICISRRVDSTGQRTLAVVTKSDQSPDGLLEKVTANDVNIGLGCICVRNRIKDESHEEARIQEATLFKTHPLLSKIDKSIVGIPVLAQRLVDIQLEMVSKSFPDIMKKIDERHDALVLEVKKLPQILTSIPDAIVAFMQIVASLKENLQKILVRGEFGYSDDKEMNCNARLVEMLEKFRKELDKSLSSYQGKYLVDEVEILKEGNGIRLSCFLPIHSAFMCLLERKVNSISDMVFSFVNKVWEYVERVCAKVIIDDCGNYPQLLPYIKKASYVVMLRMKEKLVERVSEMIEKEKITDYTCNSEFISSWNKYMGDRERFLYIPVDFSRFIINKFESEYEGKILVAHLRDIPKNKRDQAFDLKMKMKAYCEIVGKRMVDWIALEVRFVIKKMVTKEMEMEMVKMVGGGGMEKMLNEQTSVAENWEKLQRSISLLEESKEIMKRTMDGILAD